MNPRPPDSPKKIVTPRTRRPEQRSVIAIGGGLIVVESLDDDVFAIEELPEILAAHPPAIIVAQGFGQHLQRLQRKYGSDPELGSVPPGGFNYRVTPLYRYSRPWDDGRRLKQTMIHDCICNFVGWKAKRKNLPNRYHFPLDPLWFLSTGIDELDDRDTIRLVKLFEWGKGVRDWCKINGLTVKASAGGIAAQLLRDSRFYPVARRKCPGGINRIARFRLPGNYYRLHASTGRSYRAIYLDMENAHHAMARRIRFPDVDTLHAYGDFSHPEQEDKRGPRPFDNGDSPILDRPGLFHVQLAVPIVRREKFPPPYMEKAGTFDVWLYSNELAWVRELGGDIRAVYGAYVSEGYDEGLSRYANFAVDQIRKYPAYKPWLKPTLHATYGLLAARPQAFTTAHYRAKAGEPVEYPMGNVSIPAIARTREKEMESSIVNVIHRGMIEAEVRKESLTFARLMSDPFGFEVLAIYADAVFVRSGGRQLPLMEPPWRVSKQVSGLRFHSAVHFTSPSISRLPGVPRDARERLIRTRELTEHLRNERDYWRGFARSVVPS